jgi:hypothetical protein
MGPQAQTERIPKLPSIYGGHLRALRLRGGAKTGARRTPGVVGAAGRVAGGKGEGSEVAYGRGPGPWWMGRFKSVKQACDSSSIGTGQPGLRSKSVRPTRGSRGGRRKGTWCLRTARLVPNEGIGATTHNRRRTYSCSYPTGERNPWLTMLAPPAPPPCAATRPSGSRLRTGAEPALLQSPARPRGRSTRRTPGRRTSHRSPRHGARPLQSDR